MGRKRQSLSSTREPQRSLFDPRAHRPDDDRTKRVSEQEDRDLILHIVGETKEGAVVRGLRTLATLAPLSDEVLVYPNRARDADEADYAIAFALSMNAPGLKIVCRDLYAEHADPDRHP